ncbi:MAG: IclR family transcriptional regulator [Hydrogenophaga sp.]|uniref:IclR family transcriptional regulator n=1 Tax=Hydrogenophaga sp. TaxID=1904254 RepID=UPI00257D70E6|nr:IclR family transcriptional regulator [Hydrogenophaga sp.]MBL0945146.1 IclR family transcriptional regulator [Hydrogenophaga sp.]
MVRSVAVEEEQASATSNQSVTMSARILGELANSAQPLGVTELARRLDESKARVFRHLATMKQVGFVSQEQAGEEYRLGWNIYRLGVAASEQFGLLRVAQRHMTALRDQTQETTALAIPASGDALVVGSVQSERQIALSVKQGVVIGANSSALGRVILAFSPPAVQKRVLARPLKAFSPFSLTDPAELQARLQRVLTNWWEVAVNENAYGIATLAAPVFDDKNQILAAVAVISSAMHIQEKPDPALIEAVQACAAAISAEFDSTAWAQRQQR